MGEKFIHDWEDETDEFCLIWTFLSQCDGKDLLQRYLPHGKVQSSIRAAAEIWLVTPMQI